MTYPDDENQNLTPDAEPDADDLSAEADSAPETDYDLLAELQNLPATPPEDEDTPAVSVLAEPEPAEATSPVTVQTGGRSLEDLTVAELLGQMLRAPFRTLRAFIQVTQTPVNQPIQAEGVVVRSRTQQPARSASNPTLLTLVVFGLLHILGVTFGVLIGFESWRGGQILGLLLYPSVALSVGVFTLIGMKAALYPQITRFSERVKQVLPDNLRQIIKLGLWLMAIILGVVGGFVMASGADRLEAEQLSNGAPFLLSAFVLWAYAEAFASWSHRKEPAPAPPVETPAPALQIHPIRIFATLGTFLFGIFAYFLASDNTFTTLGFYLWLLSIICVVTALAPGSWRPDRVIVALRTWWGARQKRTQPGQNQWVWVAFIVILLVGAVFRLHDLEAMPQQMTSDHKEKLEDAQRVLDGDHDIFFMNNGGREGFQMYAMAIFSTLPGQEISHESLILLAVLQSILTLPVMFWLGKQIGGRSHPQFGVVLGLVLMGALAVSYWHLAITRLGLRIVLTPLIGGLLLGFLIRGVRYNQRGDYIAAGLVLGFGLYMYQAVRMMPVLVVVAIFIAAIWHIRDGRRFWRYVGHLAVIVAVSFVIFVPLFRFSVEFPDSFWMRSAGRLFGDETIQMETEDGRIISRDATLDDRLDAFQENLPQLGQNIRNALLMFHWRGDQGWINGLPYAPELDPYAGALLIAGAVSSLALLLRRRDPVYLIIPVGLFIMLLPSALSIAMVDENPSATRASGAIPMVFVLVALPLTLAVLTFRRLLVTRRAWLVGGAAVGLMLLLSLQYNWNTYYTDYRESYRFRTWPYTIPGDILEGFAMSDGAYANAFMIGYDTWWDYTIVGMEAGIVDWPNGIVGIENLPNWIASLRYCTQITYAFQPDRDLMVFYHYDDLGTRDQLESWFPDGYEKYIETYNSPTYDFRIFRVPALGDDGLRDFIETYANNPPCVLPPRTG
jgi:hypothetical protein